MQTASPTRASTDAGAAVTSGERPVSPTMVLPEHAASESRAQKIMIVLEVIFFYLHEAFEAARGWNHILKHAGQVHASRPLFDHCTRCSLSLLDCTWPPRCACRYPQSRGLQCNCLVLCSLNRMRYAVCLKTKTLGVCRMMMRQTSYQKPMSQWSQSLLLRHGTYSNKTMLRYCYLSSRIQVCTKHAISADEQL